MHTFKGQNNITKLLFLTFNFKKFKEQHKKSVTVPNKSLKSFVPNIKDKNPHYFPLSLLVYLTLKTGLITIFFSEDFDTVTNITNVELLLYKKLLFYRC